MAILTRSEIRRRIRHGDITISPTPDESQFGPNSIDLHVDRDSMRVAPYSLIQMGRPIEFHPVRAAGPEIDGVEYVKLLPNRLYLAATREYTETFNLVPYIDGRSSMGRYGVFMHITAGRGDVGYKGHWTLEICVVQPILVRFDVPWCQITYHTIEGEPTNYSGRYQDQTIAEPAASRIILSTKESS